MLEDKITVGSCHVAHVRVDKVVFVFLCRADANLNNLRSSAYEAIMDLIKYSAKVRC